MSNPDCLDLPARYGARFKLRTEAGGATWGATPEAERVWLWEVPCKYGVVYPQGGTRHAAALTSRRIGHQVAALPGIVASRGDVERVVIFDVADAEPVLALLQPRLRRRLAPEQRARATAQLQRINQERRKRTPQGVETGPKIDAPSKRNETLTPAPKEAP